MPRHYARDPAVNRSLRHSVRDGVAYSVMTGGGETYFSTFALYLQATAAQIGALAALPPLLGSLAQLLSAWVGRRLGRRKPIILIGACIQAFSWLPLALLPIWFPQWAVPLLVASIVVYYAGASFAAPQWSSLMGDLVSPRRRGRFFARRTRVASITAFFALIGGGLVLHGFAEAGATLWGYWTLFAVAACARLVSVYHLSQMHDPEGHVAALEMPLQRHTWRTLCRSAFARFALFFALMQCSVAISSPFFTVYMLGDLQYSYLEFMLTTAVVVLMQFLTLNWWGRIGDAFGNRLILVATGALIPLLPALWLVSGSFFYLIGVQIVAGMVWAGFSLSAGNFLYDLVPRARRATYMALHNVVSSIGVFIGALLGGYLASHLPREIFWQGESYTWATPLYGVFFISCVARLCVALLFLPRLKEVRGVKPMSVGGLIYRVTRFNALAGLVFDVIGSRRPPR
jgi:MFS family permease